MKQFVMRIDEYLHKKFKHYAVEKGLTMTEIILQHIEDDIKEEKYDGICTEENK